jgi:ectoine hydroxylase-related dioxygenase (phytanoyl-CoA dioxygenase family)
MSHAVLPSQAQDFDDTVQHYHANGFGIVRGLFSSDEIAAFDAEARQLVKREDLIETNNLRCRWQTDAETGACIFDAFDPIVDLGAVMARAANDPKIHALLQMLYGERGRLFKDKLIFKPPGASGYALHQDYIAWPTFPHSFLTVIVALDVADSQSGCTEVFAGMHKQGPLMPADGMYHEIPSGMIDERLGVKLQLSPGDVAFFSGFTPHRSGVNRSRRWRRQLYFSYNAESDGGDCRAAHYREYHGWLRDRYAEYGRTEVYFA